MSFEYTVNVPWYSILKNYIAHQSGCLRINQSKTICTLLKVNINMHMVNSYRAVTFSTMSQSFAIYQRQ